MLRIENYSAFLPPDQSSIFSFTACPSWRLSTRLSCLSGTRTSQDCNTRSVSWRTASMRWVSNISNRSVSCYVYCWYYHIDLLVQERCNSSALAMELRLSCTKPSISGNRHSKIGRFVIIKTHSTNCGLVMVLEILVSIAWWHQAITWTNVDFP